MKTSRTSPMLRTTALLALAISLALAGCGGSEPAAEGVGLMRVDSSSLGRR